MGGYPYLWTWKEIVNIYIYLSSDFMYWKNFPDRFLRICAVGMHEKLLLPDEDLIKYIAYSWCDPFHTMFYIYIYIYRCRNVYIDSTYQLSRAGTTHYLNWPEISGLTWIFCAFNPSTLQKLNKIIVFKIILNILHFQKNYII